MYGTCYQSCWWKPVCCSSHISDLLVVGHAASSNLFACIDLFQVSSVFGQENALLFVRARQGRHISSKCGLVFPWILLEDSDIVWQQRILFLVLKLRDKVLRFIHKMCSW